MLAIWKWIKEFIGDIWARFTSRGLLLPLLVIIMLWKRPTLGTWIVICLSAVAITYMVCETVKKVKRK